MEGDDESKSASLPEVNGYLERLTQNVLDFNEVVDDVTVADEEDESFIEMTEERYAEMKSFLKSHIQELTILHYSLGDQFAYLIIQVCNNCPSLLQNQPLKPTATSFEVLCRLSGSGFYLSKGSESVEETNEGASLKQKLQSLKVENGALKQEVEDKGTNENKEKIWNDVTEQLKCDLKEKSDLVEKPSKNMEEQNSDKSFNEHSLSRPEVKSYLKRLTRNILEFKKVVYEVTVADQLDESFIQMTKESYDGKKSFVQTRIQKLTIIHNSLADQFASLIEQVYHNCPSLLQDPPRESSESKSSPKLTIPSDSGFYLSKGEGLVEETETETETIKGLHEKIVDLKEEVASLEHKLQRVTVENGKLKQEVEESTKDITEYMAESRSTNEKKEKIWDGVIERLKKDLKEKCELVEQMSKNMEMMNLDKSYKNHLIHQMSTELTSVKFENAWARRLVDNILKLASEVTVTMEELSREVGRQREAMLDKK